MNATLSDLPAPVLAYQAGADLHDRIALHQVERGGVARVGDRWFDGGHRVLGSVADALAESPPRAGPVLDRVVDSRYLLDPDPELRRLRGSRCSCR